MGQTIFQMSISVWKPILKFMTWMNPNKSMKTRRKKKKWKRLTRSLRISFMKILMKNKSKRETYGKRMMKDKNTKISSNYRHCLKINTTIIHNFQML